MEAILDHEQVGLKGLVEEEIVLKARSRRGRLEAVALRERLLLVGGRGVGLRLVRRLEVRLER